MIDKLTAVRRDRIDRAVGRLDDDLMLRVNRALALWLGLAA
jgi:mRNA interferase MazF